MNETTTPATAAWDRMLARVAAARAAREAEEAARAEPEPSQLTPAELAQQGEW